MCAVNVRAIFIWITCCGRSEMCRDSMQQSMWFLKQSCGRGSRPSTGGQRKNWLDRGFSGPISHCLPFAPVHFITVSAVRFARVSRWDENLPITPVKPMSSPHCNTTVASLAAEMVLDVSDWLIVDKPQRSHRFVCALPPLLHCLLSEHCELQTSER